MPSLAKATSVRAGWQAAAISNADRYWLDKPRIDRQAALRPRPGALDVHRRATAGGRYLDAGLGQRVYQWADGPPPHVLVAIDGDRAVDQGLRRRS